MSKSMVRSLGAIALFGLVATGTGCASNTEMDDLRRMAADAMAAAQQAQDTANRAQATADGASGQAAQALQRADQANTCCNANTERMNRMFQKSMTK